MVLWNGPEAIIELKEEAPENEISSIPNSIDDLLVPSGLSGLGALAISFYYDYKNKITGQSNPLAYIFVPDFSQLNVANDNHPREDIYPKIELVSLTPYPRRYTIAFAPADYFAEEYGTIKEIEEITYYSEIKPVDYIMIPRLYAVRLFASRDEILPYTQPANDNNFDVSEFRVPEIEVAWTEIEQTRVSRVYLADTKSISYPRIEDLYRLRAEPISTPRNSIETLVQPEIRIDYEHEAVTEDYVPAKILLEDTVVNIYKHAKVNTLNFPVEDNLDNLIKFPANDNNPKRNKNPKTDISTIVIQAFDSSEQEQEQNVVYQDTDTDPEKSNYPKEAANDNTNYRDDRENVSIDRDPERNNINFELKYARSKNNPKKTPKPNKLRIAYKKAQNNLRYTFSVNDNTKPAYAENEVVIEDYPEGQNLQQYGKAKINKNQHPNRQDSDPPEKDPLEKICYKIKEKKPFSADTHNALEDFAYYMMAMGFLDDVREQVDAPKIGETMGSPKDFVMIVHDLETGEYYGHNDNIVLPTTCLLKPAVALAVEHYAQEYGLDLDQEITLQENLILDRERSIFNDLLPGKKVKLRDAVKRMLSESSNTDYNHVLFALGNGDAKYGMKLTVDYMHQLGLKSIQINDVHTSGSNFDANISNGADVNTLMGYLQLGILGGEYKSLVLDSLKQAIGNMYDGMGKIASKRDSIAVSGVIQGRYACTVIMNDFHGEHLSEAYLEEGSKKLFSDSTTLGLQANICIMRAHNKILSILNPLEQKKVAIQSQPKHHLY